MVSVPAEAVSRCEIKGGRGEGAGRKDSGGDDVLAAALASHTRCGSGLSMEYLLAGSEMSLLAAGDAENHSRCEPQS